MTKPWDPVDIAWVAGIIEGEGCFNIRRTAGKYPLAICSVSMTDFDVIQRLHEVTGIGRVGSLRVDKRGSQRKPTLNWTVAKKRDMARLMLAVYPLMGERRRKKIAEAIEVVAQDNRAKPMRHGTKAGYDKELRQGLRPCTDCRAANTAAHREWRKTRDVQSNGDGKPAEAPANGA